MSAGLRAELESVIPPDVLDSLVDGLDRVAIAMNPPDGSGERPPRAKGARRPKVAKH